MDRGWSQEKLAFECELDRTYVSAVEQSRWNVSLSNIERLARALETPIWMLLKLPIGPGVGTALPEELAYLIAG